MFTLRTLKLGLSGSGKEVVKLPLHSLPAEVKAGARLTLWYLGTEATPMVDYTVTVIAKDEELIDHQMVFLNSFWHSSKKKWFFAFAKEGA